MYDKIHAHIFYSCRYWDTKTLFNSPVTCNFFTAFTPMQYNTVSVVIIKELK